MTPTRTGMLKAIGMIAVSCLALRKSSCKLIGETLSVPPGERKFYKSPFFRDFWHLNVAMMTSNNALIPDPDKQDILASQPTDWPFMHLGLRMCGWGDSQTKYYLLGTPIIWWSGAVSLIICLLTLAIYMFRIQRKYKDMEPCTSTFALDSHITYERVSQQRSGTSSFMCRRLRSWDGSCITVRLDEVSLSLIRFIY